MPTPVSETDSHHSAFDEPQLIVIFPHLLENLIALFIKLMNTCFSRFLSPFTRQWLACFTTLSPFSFAMRTYKSSMISGKSNVLISSSNFPDSIFLMVSRSLIRSDSRVLSSYTVFIAFPCRIESFPHLPSLSRSEEHTSELQS